MLLTTAHLEIDMQAAHTVANAVDACAAFGYDVGMSMLPSPLIDHKQTLVALAANLFERIEDVNGGKTRGETAATLGNITARRVTRDLSHLATAQEVLDAAAFLAADRAMELDEAGLVGLALILLTITAIVSRISNSGPGDPVRWIAGITKWPERSPSAD